MSNQTTVSRNPQVSRRVITDYHFRKLSYNAIITFCPGKRNVKYTFSIPAWKLKEKGLDEKGLFKALVEKADKMELPKPRHYHVEGLYLKKDLNREKSSF